MAGFDGLRAVSLVAGADLSARQFRFVKLTGVETIDVNGAGDPAIGILQDKPGNTQTGIVGIAGRLEIEAGAAISAGGLIQSDAVGRAVPSVGGHVLGTAVLSSSGAGEIIEMMFEPRGDGAGIGVIDHGSLGGLSDDDHSQYGLLAGRTGGQTFIGGTDASDNLVLRSTSNGTKGNVAIEDVYRQKVHSLFAGSSSFRTTEAIQTTSTAATTMLSQTLQDDSVYWVDAKITGRDIAGVERAVYFRQALVFREGAGLATFGGSGVNSTFTDETDAAMNGTLTVAFDDVRVVVTGLTATTINWACTLEFQPVSGAA